MKSAAITRTGAACAASALLLGLFGVLPAAAAQPAQPAQLAQAATSETGALFTRTATYPVFENRPEGVDASAATVAEISTVTADGMTMIYTDAAGKRIGFIDISDPSNPVGLGTVALDSLGEAAHADDQPTSVAVHGDYVLVVIDESGGDFVNPSGRLEVLRVSDRSSVASIPLGGQPDSIAISPDGAYAAIAMENQRDEEFTPEGASEGDLPQLPAGFVQLIELAGEPASWQAEPIALVNEDGTALAALTDAGLDTAVDPEPEYVAINSKNQLALSLQENNGIVVIDLPTREITNVFSAGTVSASGLDTEKDGRIDQSGSITDVPREPDAIAWVDDAHIATANEGDWKGGSRGWSIFDSATGAVTWDAGASFAQLAIQHGLHNEDRAAKKGAEPEGLAVATFDGVRYGFIASERSNFIAVYDLSDPAAPVFVETLFSTNGPEGVLPIPARGVLAVSSETDEADAGVRSAVNLYALDAPADVTQQPSIISAQDAGGLPIGWSALGALSAVPGDSSHVYTASDSALKPSTIFSVDVSVEPAVIDDALVITQNSAPAELDIEGFFARPQGGFWLAAEGKDGAGNQLHRADASGAIVETIALPADVTAHIAKWGLEGVTATTDADGNELLYVAVQRPLWLDAADPTATLDGENVTRIGRYDVAAASWSWFGYELETTEVAGDWMGLSEIVAVDANTLAVIERDKLNGPNAAIKRVYTVSVPDAAPAASEPLAILPKTLAIDVLPAMQATNGWTQEKLEGLTIGADGNVYAITDNDGLKDSTGETVFMRLGSAETIFGAEQQRPTLSLSAASIAAGEAVELRGSNFAADAELALELRSAPVSLGTATADASGAFTISVKVPAATTPGAHTVVAILTDGTEVSAALTVTAAGGGTTPGGGNGPGDGSAGEPGAGGSDADLADTGADGVLPLLLGAGGLLLAGAAIVVGRRMRIASGPRL